MHLALDSFHSVLWTHLADTKTVGLILKVKTAKVSKISHISYISYSFSRVHSSCLERINASVLISAALKPDNQSVKCHHCTNTLWPHRAATQQNNALLQSMYKKTAQTYKNFDRAQWLVGWGNRSRTGRKVEPLLSDRIVSRCDKVITELRVHAHKLAHNQTYAKRFAKLTRRVCRWTRCSFPHLSFQWKLHMSVSPSDAWPA